MVSEIKIGSIKSLKGQLRVYIEFDYGLLNNLQLFYSYTLIMHLQCKSRGRGW